MTEEDSSLRAPDETHPCPQAPPRATGHPSWTPPALPHRHEALPRRCHLFTTRMAYLGRTTYDHNHTPPHGTCRKHPWPRNTTRPHETTHDACAVLPSPHLGLRARQADSTPLTSDANDLSSAPPCRSPRPSAARTRPKISRLDVGVADELEPRGPARQLTVARPTSSTPGVHADADHATTALTADPNDGAPDPPSGASCPSSTRPLLPRRSAAPATRRTGTRNTTRRSARTPMPPSAARSRPTRLPARRPALLPTASATHPAPRTTPPFPLRHEAAPGDRHDDRRPLAPRHSPPTRNRRARRCLPPAARGPARRPAARRRPSATRSCTRTRRPAQRPAHPSRSRSRRHLEPRHDAAHTHASAHGANADASFPRPPAAPATDPLVGVLSICGTQPPIANGATAAASSLRPYAALGVRHDDRHPLAPRIDAAHDDQAALRAATSLSQPPRSSNSN